MKNLLTDNPAAIKALMSETLFSAGQSFSDSQEDEFVEATSIQTPLSAEVKTDVTEEFIYQGNKDRGIIFILRYQEYPYFSAGAQEAFVKTIGALQLTPSDVVVVNLANPHNPNDFKRIMQFFTPTKIILLGVEPTSLVLPHIPHNSYMKGRVATVFNTYSFEEMFVDIEKKKAFWIEFKTFIAS
ncbi:hypothetical protein ACR79T_05710 [Sphingobacterium spiritivorum]|uniref:hypothetical protein n=1 Tax=Sphingobacterium spiritivorum TaxID=258 RepID=UPI003DA3CA6C